MLAKFSKFWQALGGLLNAGLQAPNAWRLSSPHASRACPVVVRHNASWFAQVRQPRSTTALYRWQFRRWNFSSNANASSSATNIDIQIEWCITEVVVQFFVLERSGTGCKWEDEKMHSRTPSDTGIQPDEMFTGPRAIQELKIWIRRAWIRQAGAPPSSRHAATWTLRGKRRRCCLYDRCAKISYFAGRLLDHATCTSCAWSNRVSGLCCWWYSSSYDSYQWSKNERKLRETNAASPTNLVGRKGNKSALQTMSIREYFFFFKARDLVRKAAPLFTATGRFGKEGNTPHFQLSTHATKQWGEKQANDHAIHRRTIGRRYAWVWGTLQIGNMFYMFKSVLGWWTKASAFSLGSSGCSTDSCVCICVLCVKRYRNWISEYLR